MIEGTQEKAKVQVNLVLISSYLPAGSATRSSWNGPFVLTALLEWSAMNLPLFERLLYFCIQKISFTGMRNWFSKVYIFIMGVFYDTFENLYALAGRSKLNTAVKYGPHLSSCPYGILLTSDLSGREELSLISLWYEVLRHHVAQKMSV